MSAPIQAKYDTELTATKGSGASFQYRCFLLLRVCGVGVTAFEGSRLWVKQLRVTLKGLVGI